MNLSVHPGATELGTPWEAQVCDLSVTGIGLLLARRFERGSVLTVALANKAGDFKMVREVEVLHLVAADGNRWFIGGTLTERLTKEELRKLL